MAEHTSVLSLSRERREAGLALSIDNDDRVCQDDEQLHVWYITSASEEGKWHTVDLHANNCSCKAYEYRGYCRHIIRAWWETDRIRKEEVTQTQANPALVA